MSLIGFENPVNTLNQSVKEESLVINGNGFDEVTEAAEVMALDFRDNFDQHSAAVLGNRKSMGWRNEKYGVYGVHLNYFLFYDFFRDKLIANRVKAPVRNGAQLL